MALKPCKTCAFFVAEFGQCRRYPPQVLMITDVKPPEKEGGMPEVFHRHQGIWPLLDPEHGSCGEHKPNLIIN